MLTPVGRPAVRQDRAFVGRQVELQVLADLVDDGGGPVGHLHGIAGIGKSVLLCRSLRLARDAGVGVLALDCRTVEPTEKGVLRATGGFPDVIDRVRGAPPGPADAILSRRSPRPR
ncbi:ATP-binding protein [Modestobacter excelsi]|uniref:ATP-binding protein n=1 Tax=Modestobacter excelsi TaxID=2213161 RepID=UPI00110CE24B|nr:ATP-binding protein [Modestobacter excelsi]